MVARENLQCTLDKDLFTSEKIITKNYVILDGEASHVSHDGPQRILLEGKKKTSRNIKLFAFCLGVMTELFTILYYSISSLISRIFSISPQ